MPKMLFESDEEPAGVLQLLGIRSQQQHQTWKEGKATDSARRTAAGSSVTVVGFFTFYHESKYP